MTNAPAVCVLPHFDDDGQGGRTPRERPTPAVEGTLLCKGHYARLLKTVAGLPALAAELDAAMVPGSGAGGPKVGGDPETALPFVEKPGEHVRRIRDVLAAWASQVVESRRLVAPRFTVDALVRFLTVHHEWIAGQEWVPLYLGEVGQLRHRGRQILAAVPQRKVDLGPCGEPIACNVHTRFIEHCEGILRATVSTVDDELPSVVACTACGREHSAPEWRALARRLRGTKDAWLTGPQLSEMWRLPFSTVRRWAAEDGWRRHPDGKRPTRFHVDDAVAGYERRGRAEAAS